MTVPAPPPGWETRDRTNSTLWRYRPARMHVDLELHPALPLPTLGKHHTVRCVILNASSWYRFTNPTELRRVAAALNSAADWLDTPTPELDGQLALLEEAHSAR